MQDAGPWWPAFAVAWLALPHASLILKGLGCWTHPFFACRAEAQGVRYGHLTYSSRSAETGSSLAARDAGITPASSPITSEMPSASRA